jgi:hypothetical protein
MTIVNYLGNKCAFDISRGTIETILLDRGIACATEAAFLSNQNRDLLYADCLLHYYYSPTSSFRKSHGNYSIQQGSESKSDRKDALQYIRYIYTLYGDNKLMSIPVESVMWINETDEEN